VIFLARHGETVDNAARVIQLPAAALSAAGQAQAERLAQRLVPRDVVRILASDLARAVATAQRIGTRLGLAVELDPLLRERDFGDLRGTPYAELKVDPFAPAYVPPAGESWDAFHARAARAWKRILEVAAQADGNLLVVTHGLVCRAIVERHLALPPGVTAPLRWDNCSLTEVDAAAPWTVRRLNCVEHLAGELHAGGLA
jgi:2,3-bisphosphoglycerate-dependent phosphoglycerate mutase